MYQKSFLLIFIIVNILRAQKISVSDELDNSQYEEFTGEYEEFYGENNNGTFNSVQISDNIPDEMDIEQQMRTIRKTRMNRKSAIQLQRVLKVPLDNIYGLGRELQEKKNSSVRQRALYSAFSTTQNCLIFTKNFIRQSAKTITDAPMWHNVDVTCSKRCNNKKIKYDEVKKKSSVCLDCSYPDRELAPQTYATIPGTKLFKNMYDVKRFVKVNQLYVYSKCYGKLVRGTKKVDDEDSQKNQDLSLVFTDQNVHHWAESTAWNDNEKYSLDISKSYGTEADDVTMSDNAQYLYLKDPNNNSKQVWVKWTPDMLDDEGYKVEKDDSRLETIGNYGGGMCKCTNQEKKDHNLKYRVGGLSISMNGKLDFSESCKSGNIEANSEAHNVVENDPKFKGLVVQCDVNDFSLLTNGNDSDTTYNHHCTGKMADQYSSEQEELENFTEISERLQKIQDCVDDIKEKKTKFASQEWTHLSFQRWHEYKKLHRLSFGLPSPCAHIYGFGTSVSSFRWNNGFQDFDFLNGKDDYYHYIENLNKWVEFYDQCMDSTIFPEKELCSEEKNPNASYIGGNWVIQNEAQDTIVNGIFVKNKDLSPLFSNLSPGSDRWTQWEESVNSFQKMYHDICLIESANCKFTSFYEIHKSAYKTIFYPACESAVRADRLLDMIGVLGVGCPEPWVPKQEVPPEPCWMNGWQNCPPPELEKCDVIAREMTKIVKKVQLTAKHAKCFSQSLSSKHVETKLRYFCVSQGVWDLSNQDVDGLNNLEDMKARQEVFNLGESTYNITEEDEGSRPAYLQKIKEALDNLKAGQEAKQSLEFWNENNGLATENTASVTVSGG